MSVAPNIAFEQIKARLGSQRNAFEELSFQLFAREFNNRGQLVRREGAGGDAGLEGFVADSAGRVLIGVQAKYFIGQFNSGWWSQMDGSAKTALRANAHHRALERYVFCTPLTFTERQQKKWEECVAQWKAYAQQLGYAVEPEFEHWDRSQFEELLTKQKNRGLLLYYFSYPDFDGARCSAKNASTITGLHDRYIPDLHTPTDCEFALHRFLRSHVLWNDFAESTRRNAAQVLTGPWTIDPSWRAPLIQAAEHLRERRTAILTQLGDGCRLPASFSRLVTVIDEFDEAVARFEEAFLVKPQNSSNESELREALEKQMGSIGGLGNWRGWIESEADRPDSQCCLVLGGAGTGKTQTLAEICARYEQAGCIVLFIEGRLFTSTEDPWAQFLRWLDFPGGRRDFLDSFAALAASTPLSGLICIDALNETPHRDVWRHGLDDFASELRPYPNLKLIVSCRTDFADLTLPQTPAIEGSGWVIVNHHGLGAQVIEAAPKYLHAYDIRGYGITPFTPEFTNPLLLKTFCEAYQGEAVPQGSLSLDRILRKYIERKAANIQARIGCASSVVRDALRDLAQVMSATGILSLPEKDARELLDSRHPTPDESRRLYPALRSEGVLHELRDVDEFGETISVRFAYERIWDYALSLHLLPDGAAVSNELQARLVDARWRRSNPGLLALLAIRVPEAGHGELHDVAGLQPRESHELDLAFASSIVWRTRANFTSRTEELFNQITHRDRAAQLFADLSLAPHEEHPWNADHLHECLSGMTLSDRDKTWTIQINDTFTSRYDTVGPGFLIRLGASESAATLSDNAAFLLATGLAWLLTTTNVQGRARVAVSLARLLATRPRIAAQLVRRFSSVNDPYVVECVFFAAAACAKSSMSGTELAELVDAVYSAVFAGDVVAPNIPIRYYAQVVCEEGLSKSSLPENIAPRKFRPPYNSVWPATLTEDDEQRLEQEARSDIKAKRALGQLLSSTVTEQMGGYGDWGRYEMGWRVALFQSRRRDEDPLREYNSSSFDDRIARRYVLKRVLELGLDKTLDDTPRYNPNVGRSRPPIERVGKKYQWIALHEFLGFLGDHYHPRADSDGIVRESLTAVDLHLPDLLDPVLVRGTRRSTRDWRFIPPPPPWWADIMTPLPTPFDDSARREFVTSTEAPDPVSLLVPNDGHGSWLTVQGHWGWKEPVRCYEGGPHETARHCQMSWHFNSYAVPSQVFDEFIARMRAPVLDGNMIPRPPEYRRELAALSSYPEDADACARWCEETHAQLSGCWFTTASYSNRQEGEQALRGEIPSPQLARLLGVRWTGEAVNFAQPISARVIVGDCDFEDHDACLVRFDEACAALRRADLRLVWRFYGWKWIYGGSHEHDPQREYWGLYALDGNDQPRCISGGTWISRTRAIEPLPWT